MATMNSNDFGAEIRDWQQVLSRFTYPSGENIKQRLLEKSPDNLREDYDIINAIALWKLNRQVSIEPKVIEQLNVLAADISTPSQATTDPRVPELITALISSDGVRLAMASTILKFYQRQAFPIIDQRAYEAIVVYANDKSVEKILPANAGADVYLWYIEQCANIGEEHSIPFEHVDEVLYQIHKDLGGTLVR